ANGLMPYPAHQLYAVDITCLRFFTVFGPRQRPDLAIHKFARLMAAAQPIELYGDGSTSRDYTFIDDIIDGVVAAIDQPRGAAPGYRIHNLGGPRTTTLKQLVDLVAKALAMKPTIETLPEQPGDMKQTLADVTLSSQELGYAPKVSMEEGIRRFADWWRASESL